MTWVKTHPLTVRYGQETGYNINLSKTSFSVKWDSLPNIKVEIMKSAFRELFSKKEDTSFWKIFQKSKNMGPKTENKLFSLL